jgi:hypothetical protein
MAFPGRPYRREAQSGEVEEAAQRPGQHLTNMVSTLVGVFDAYGPERALRLLQDCARMSIQNGGLSVQDWLNCLTDMAKRLHEMGRKDVIRLIYQHLQGLA